MEISVIIILLLIWEGTIVNLIPTFQHFDEMLMVIFFIMALIKIMKIGEIRLKKNEIISIILLIIYFIIGFLSNYISDILVEPDKYILSGILSTKFIIMYILCRIGFNNIKINYSYLNKIYKFFNIVLFTYSCITLINIKFDFFRSFGERFGVETVSVGFTHPSELDFFAISIMVIQLFLMIILQKDMKKYKYICASAFIIILFAGRTKSIVFFISYIMVIFGLKFIKRIKLRHIGVMIPISIIIAKERIISEFINSGSIRGTLYRVAVQIANDFFPLGSGFGTYGSEMSRDIYSSLYYQYNMNNIYGFSINHPSYITDAHWAAIIGETGWIGFLISAIIIILLTTTIIKATQSTRLKIAISSLWVYGLTSSISDTILITYRGIAIVLIVTFFMAIIETIESKKNIE